jgi:hypothetical protein
MHNLANVNTSSALPTLGSIWVVKNSVDGLETDLEKHSSYVEVIKEEKNHITYKFFCMNFESVYTNTRESFLEMFYFIKNQRSIELFSQMLENHTLDPMWFEYNCTFLAPYKTIHYMPGGKREEVQEKEDKGIYRLHGSFEDTAWGFDIDVPADRVAEVQAKLDKHIKSDKFQEILRDRYTGFKFVRSNYFDKEFGFISKHWWSDNDMGESYELDVLLSDEFPNMLELHTEKAKKVIVEDKVLKSGTVIKHEQTEVRVALIKKPYSWDVGRA